MNQTTKVASSPWVGMASMSLRGMGKTHNALGSQPTSAINSTDCASGAALDPPSPNQVDMLKL